MNYDPEIILEDHELDALAREVIATDNTTARRQYGRLVIEQTLLRIRGRTPVSRLNPILAQARTQATNVYGSNPKLRNAFEDGARWLLDSGLVIEKEKIMAKNSVDVYGAVGKTNTLFFTPESLMLISDPNHPLYDERIYLPLDEAMVLNIMAQGVLEPIIIWKDPESGATCVVDGRQRVRHAIEANRRLVARGEEPITVPGVVRRGSAVKMAQAMVSANEIRRADTPLGRAKKMAALQERGHDDDDLALVFGCSTATVRATLSLLDSPAAVQQAVEAGQINATHARQLAKLPLKSNGKVEELIQAGTGVRPHERSRKQRAVMANDKPRLRTRKEITAELERHDGPFADALRWVLGIADNKEAA